MCLHGVKAQEGAVLGGVGPARRGRAGQRWGWGGDRDRGARRAPGRSSAAQRTPRGRSGARGSLHRGRKLRGRPRSLRGVRRGRGRCGALRAGARREGRPRSGTGGSRTPPPPCAGRAGAAGSAAGSGAGSVPAGRAGGRGRGGMELPEGPASRPCGCAAAAEEQVRRILT